MLIFSAIFLLLSNAVTLRRDKSILYNRVAILALLCSFLFAFNTLYFTFLNKGIGLFGGLFHQTSITQIFHLFIFLVTMAIIQLTAFYPRKVWIAEYSSINKQFRFKFLYYRTKIIEKMGQQFKIIEYPLILLFIITGAVFLICASDLVSIFIYIELQSYGLYLLSTLYINSELATSGDFTYFLLGALSCFILEISLLYANSGTNNLDGIKLFFTYIFVLIYNIFLGYINYILPIYNFYIEYKKFISIIKCIVFFFSVLSHNYVITSGNDVLYLIDNFIILYYYILLLFPTILNKYSKFNKIMTKFSDFIFLIHLGIYLKNISSWLIHVVYMFNGRWNPQNNGGFPQNNSNGPNGPNGGGNTLGVPADTPDRRKQRHGVYFDEWLTNESRGRYANQMPKRHEWLAFHYGEDNQGHPYRKIYIENWVLDILYDRPYNASPTPWGHDKINTYPRPVQNNTYPRPVQNNRIVVDPYVNANLNLDLEHKNKLNRQLGKFF